MEDLEPTEEVLSSCGRPDPMNEGSEVGLVAISLGKGLIRQLDEGSWPDSGDCDLRHVG